ncbi:MAG: ParB/RepB/Spo0J family partition protein [Patescibacteria group bacterium]
MSATVAKVKKSNVIEIRITDIITDGVACIRELYEIESLESLGESISEIEVLEPILVVKTKNDRYELIIGSRRIKASQRAGKETIPAMVIEEELDDKTKIILALSENIHREDLTPFEEARAILKLISQYGMTLKEVAQSLKREESRVRNRIKLLKLPRDVQELISKLLASVPSK